LIDAAKTPCRYQPGAQIVRHALLRPLLQRGAESVVQRFLCPIEIAEQPDQGREDGARFALIYGLDPPVEIRFWHRCLEDSNFSQAAEDGNAYREASSYRLPYR